MKRFLYCESTEGGMDQFEMAQGNYPTTLRGWMDTDCEREDLALMTWMAHTAEVGEYTSHRLGLCIRLKDR